MTLLDTDEADRCMSDVDKISLMMEPQSTCRVTKILSYSDDQPAVVKFTREDGSKFKVSHGDWIIGDYNSIHRIVSNFNSTGSEYVFNTRRYYWKDKKSDTTLLDPSTVKDIPDPHMVDQILSMYPHQQAHEDREELNIKKPLELPIMKQPKSLVKVFLNYLLAPVRGMGKVIPLIYVVLLLTATILLAVFAFKMAMCPITYPITSAFITVGFFILFCDFSDITSGNKRWKIIREIKCNVYINQKVDLTPEGLQKVNLMVQSASDTQDLRRIETICHHLKRVTVALKEELDQRLEEEKVTLHHVKSLYKEVCHDLSSMDKSSEEYAINKLIVDDLEKNLDEMNTYNEDVTKTANIAKYMAKYLDTRLVLISRSVNRVRITDICKTYVGMVNLFKSLGDRTEMIAQTGDAEIGLIAESTGGTMINA